jgi:hypothetical protein
VGEAGADLDADEVLEVASLVASQGLVADAVAVVVARGLDEPLA